MRIGARKFTTASILRNSFVRDLAIRGLMYIELSSAWYKSLASDKRFEYCLTRYRTLYKITHREYFNNFVVEIRKNEKTYLSQFLFPLENV